MQVAIRSTCINRAGVNIDPFAILLYAFRLFRCKNYITETLLDQDIECLVVTSGFRQPERFRLSPKAVTKVFLSPDDLGQQVTVVTEGQDRMSIRLCYCVAMAASLASAITVS